MGGLGPGIGGFEILVIGLVALLVVGPKDLPMLMRRVGQFVGKARGMANEFRASFDEMARQSELDDLRKEVEALRSGQGMYALGADADEAFKDIRKELEAPAVPGPVEQAPAQIEVTGVDEWPDSATPVVAPEPAPKPATKPRAKKAVAPADAAASKVKPRKATPKSDAPSSSSNPAAARARSQRAKKVDL